MKRTTMPVLLLMLAVTLALGVVGCVNGASEQVPQTGTTPEGTPPTSLGVVAAPGLYDVEGGKTQALGTLDYRDLESGFWAVVDTAVPEDAATADIVAVIPNADELGVDLESMKGSYVSAIGTKLEGASAQQAGPQIEAEKIEIVTDTTVETK